jgi:hypothetical protein
MMGDALNRVNVRYLYIVLVFSNFCHLIIGAFIFYGFWTDRLYT